MQRPRPGLLRPGSRGWTPRHYWITNYVALIDYRVQVCECRQCRAAWADWDPGLSGELGANSGYKKYQVSSQMQKYQTDF